MGQNLCFEQLSQIELWTMNSPTQKSTGNELASAIAELLETYPDRPNRLSGTSPQTIAANKVAELYEAFARSKVPTINWNGDASCGKGNWARTPWAAVYDSQVSSKASEGIYPVIHFLFNKDDGIPGSESGVRLGIGLSVTEFKGGDLKNQLQKIGEEFSRSVDSETKENFWFAGSPSERPTEKPTSGLVKKYYSAMLVEAFFSLSKLKENDDEFSLRLSQLIELYSKWVSQFGNSAQPNESIEFLNEIRWYQENGVVFVSPMKRRMYCVQSVEEDRCVIKRLSGGEIKEITVNSFESSLKRIEENDGIVSLDELINADQVVKTTFLQSPALALSLDRKSAKSISNTSNAKGILLEYFKGLRVNKNGDEIRIYKPALVAIVLEGILDGSLGSNRIEIEWALEKFNEFGLEHGHSFSNSNFADGFYRLSSEPFWLLCYSNPDDALTPSDISPGKLRSTISHAAFRPVFWKVLQDKEFTKHALNQIQDHWLSSSKLTWKIDEVKLKEAVDKVIRPRLIDDGHLFDSSREGYHHSKIIPNAQPLLTRDKLTENTKDNLINALKAKQNLLSQFEFMSALQFIEEAVENEIKSKAIDFLWGEKNLESRIAEFLGWSKQSKNQDGRNVGFNGTSASYLLAVSQPEKYAFCKPMVYTAAAEHLLGKQFVAKDPIERLVHTTAFYEKALQLLVDDHQLPFSDLMHAHIAFYVMQDRSSAYSTWKEDSNKSDIVRENHDIESKKTEVDNLELNLILYGPPGTGKTYSSIEQAVSICDGELALDRQHIVERFKALQNEGRIEFVTFHQSYGYEDFVEGIRPLLSNGDGSSEGGSQVQYECKEGVFKKICRLAGSRITGGSARSTFDPSAQTVWKMSLGDSQDPEQDFIYEECIQENKILLGYGEDIDFTSCESKQDIEEKLRETNPETKSSDYAIKAVNSFKNEMKNRDFVVVTDGNSKFRAIGQIDGEYEFTIRDGYQQKRSVSWMSVYESSVPREQIYKKNFSQPTIYRLREESLKVESFGQIVSSGSNSSLKNYVLIIDEINRGNVSKIFGELITLLESDKRLDADNELRVTLPYSAESFGVPRNLFLIGTMNTADRSIAFIDTALRRRFKFVEMMPSSRVIRDLVGNGGAINEIDVAHILDTINARIELLFDRDHQLGHSYFISCKNLVDLREVFCNKVIPLLQEYFYGDWGKVCTVLGCPFHEETGEQLAANSCPMIKAKLLDVEDLPGGAQDEFANKIRCRTNPDFESASQSELVNFFKSISG